MLNKLKSEIIIYYTLLSAYSYFKNCIDWIMYRVPRNINRVKDFYLLTFINGSTKVCTIRSEISSPHFCPLYI